MMSFSYYDSKLLILALCNHQVLMIMHWVVHFSLINSGILPGSTLVHVLDVGFFKLCYIFSLY